MQVNQFLAVLLVAGLVAGCVQPRTTVSYDVSKNQTTYRSGEMTLARGISESGLRSTTLLMRAIARCGGQNCTPRSVRLSFSVEGGTDVDLANRDVVITADGESFTWRDRGIPTPAEGLPDEGHITDVSVPLSALEYIARASSVSGTLGNTSLEMEGSVQSSLHEFVQTTKQSRRSH